jgi:hypothetical protein
LASDLTGVRAKPEAQEAPKPEDRSRGIRPAHRSRFMFVYLVLAAALGAALAGIVLLVGTGTSSDNRAWSAWAPTKDGQARVGQIAAHVSKEYRLTKGGAQLLDVIAKPPAVQDVPIKAVAVRNPTSGDADEVSLFDDTNSLMFVLCGGGQACSISKGKPTVERGRLVRRETLELALYTFKYVGSVNYIVAFMPPKKGDTPQYVVYFHRGDFEKELSHPLSETLALKVPLAKAITPREATMIDRLTDRHMFKFSLQQAQQGDAILVLDPAV